MRPVERKKSPQKNFSAFLRIRAGFAEKNAVFISKPMKSMMSTCRYLYGFRGIWSSMSWPRISMTASMPDDRYDQKQCKQFLHILLPFLMWLLTKVYLCLFFCVGSDICQEGADIFSVLVSAKNFLELSSCLRIDTWLMKICCDRSPTFVCCYNLLDKKSDNWLIYIFTILDVFGKRTVEGVDSTQYFFHLHEIYLIHIILKKGNLSYLKNIKSKTCLAFYRISSWSDHLMISWGTPSEVSLRSMR